MSQTITAQVTISHSLGLHLRAAGALVQVATPFQSDIIIEYGNIKANGKSIMSVLSLAAPCGAKLKLSASGADANATIQAIVEIVNNDFNL